MLNRTTSFIAIRTTAYVHMKMRNARIMQALTIKYLLENYKGEGGHG